MDPLTVARFATADDLPHAVETLTDGFAEDPVISWIFDSVADEPTRSGMMARWWGAHVEPFPAGAHLLVDPHYRSAAIWHEPAAADHERGDGRVLAETLVEALGEEVAYAKLGALAVVGEAHPRTPPHWYLAAVATRRAHQGTGCGPVVVRPVLERCDAERVPAYLESSNPRNVGFYERLGFEVTDEIHVADGPLLTTMWREPR